MFRLPKDLMLFIRYKSLKIFCMPKEEKNASTRCFLFSHIISEWAQWLAQVFVNKETNIRLEERAASAALGCNDVSNIKAAMALATSLLQ
nr:hypothetical protein [Tanacetum cinerariifolium]